MLTTYVARSGVSLDARRRRFRGVVEEGDGFVEGERAAGGSCGVECGLVERVVEACEGGSARVAVCSGERTRLHELTSGKTSSQCRVPSLSIQPRVFRSGVFCDRPDNDIHTAGTTT